MALNHGAPPASRVPSLRFAASAALDPGGAPATGVQLQRELTQNPDERRWVQPEEHRSPAAEKTSMVARRVDMATLLSQTAENKLAAGKIGPTLAHADD